MPFAPQSYGPEIAQLLALAGDGERLMPLVCSAGRIDTPELRKLTAHDLAACSHPRGAHAALWVYFSCFDEAHEIAQEDHSAEGSYWHAILHRQEPDASNAAYWFRRVGQHAVFPELAKAAEAILEAGPDCGFRVRNAWDPSAFIDFCESARQDPGSAAEQAALEIQRAEWQILFHYCAARGRKTA